MVFVVNAGLYSEMRTEDVNSFVGSQLKALRNALVKRSHVEADSRERQGRLL